ncbi:MAG TPA: AsmA family protein [Verrucomicrobiae bacterium]
MTEKKAEAPSPARGGWLRKLVWIAGGLVILLVVAWFVVTSGAFFKGVVLPRVGAAMNAEVTVADASLSPFSQVVLRDLKVVPKGAEPLLTAAEVRARYRLMAILGGNIAVEEVAIVNPTVTLVENADGTSNLDPILKSQQPPTGKPDSTSGAKPSAPPALDIKSVKLSNATVRRTQNFKGGGRDVLELSGVNLTLSDLKNGQTGKLELSAALALDQSATTNTPASSLRAKAGGAFAFDLTKDLMPGAAKGNLTLAVDRATGAFTEAAGLAIKLDAEATPTEVRQLAVRFTKAAESLGELRVSGPFDPTKLEGKLKLELAGVDKKLLNLAGAAGGLDFGSTTVGLTTEVELTKAGGQVAASGRLNIARFQVTQQGQTTPTFDLLCDYSVTVDNTAQSAVLKSLNLTGTQGQRPLLQAMLTAPMTVAWGNTANAVGDSALNLTVNALDLADWKPFVGEIAPAGKVDVNVKLLSQKAGQQLQFEARAGVADLLVLAGTNRFAGLGLNVTAQGQASDLKQIRLTRYSAQFGQNGRQILSAEGTGAYNLATQAADAEAKATLALAAAMQMNPLPDISITAGAVELQTKLAHTTNSDAVTGKVSLRGLTGTLATTKLTDFGVETDLDILKTGQKVQIRKASGTLANGGLAGGAFDASGSYDLATNAGEIALKLVNLNQNALAPFLASALGDKKLVSVAIHSTVSANLAANGDASAKADLQVTNLVVNDPKGGLPATPLEAWVQADAAVAKQVAQVRQLQFTLTPTDRAKNELGLTGSVDFSKTNAITGSLKLAAESLDVTRYYDLFAADTKATAPTAPAAAPPPASDPNKEPDAVTLPLRNFTFDAGIGRFYLREVAITNLQTTVKLDGGHVAVKPFQLALNGAPVSATVDADLGVPGFKYDLAFNADNIPLAPLVNSFVPERKGQIAGTTTANAQIRGAGVTGANLQKNLTGQFSLLATNMDLSIANVRSPLINTIINVIVGIPDLIRNPTAIIGNVLGSLTGASRPRTGWADQLTASPISVIDVRGSAGNGRVELRTAEVRSAAFQATAAGAVDLDRVLTNSAILFPVTVSLSRELGDKIGLVTANTPTNQVYVALPDFLKMKGTIGEPKADINKLALVGLAAKTGAGVVQNIGGATGEKVGGILGAVGGLLGGGTAQPATSTNAPAPAATNTSPAAPVGDLLRGLGGLLDRGRSTTRTNR